MLERPQIVKLGNNVSSTLVLNTVTPQECVLSPKLYSLFTYDCKIEHQASLIIKFADYTTVTGFVNNNDEVNYHGQIDTIVGWCDDNNLLLNVSQTKEMIVYFRRDEVPPPPRTINGSIVEQVTSFKFLGTHVSNSLTWDTHCNQLLKKAWQRMLANSILSM